MIPTVDIIKSYILNKELNLHDDIESGDTECRLLTCKLTFSKSSCKAAELRV